MKSKHKRFPNQCLKINERINRYTRDSQEGKTKLLLAKDVF